MLSKEMNETLTRVGPGTPMGDLMRRYWHPVAASVELEENPVKKVRLLCEDLVLYKDRSGNLGLIDEPCPHRRVSLEYGIPEQQGLRCPYHGWLFNAAGQCTEQPGEPWDSTFKDRIRTKAYPVKEMAGLIFAYLGPQPAPLLPNYDVLVWDNAIRHIGVTMLPCNWLQCMENSLDPIHVEWLHGRFMDYMWERKGQPSRTQYHARHKKIGFDRFEHGMLKRRVVEGNTEEDDAWKIGHPVIFPNILRVGGGFQAEFQYRVPVDDTHTWHVCYAAHVPGFPIPPQESIPLYEVPLTDEQGRYLNEVNRVQDMWAWISQGPIAERDLEKLGQSDIGIIMYRELLKEQIERVQQGLDPMEVYRAPHPRIDLPGERVAYDANDERMQAARRNVHSGYKPEQTMRKFSPIVNQIAELFAEADRRSAAGERLVAPAEPPIYAPAQDLRAVDLLP